ncbi:hypothetical protein ACHAP8_007014 [Fusarium lateritium]
MNRYWTRILSTVLAKLFLAAVTLKTIYPGNDPYRCRAAQNTGRWIDPVRDEEGNRDPFLQWQPDGCILNPYESEDIRRCMEGRRIVVSGDSTSKHVARAMGHMLDSKHFKKDDLVKGLPKMKSFNLTYHGLKIERLTNVWISAHDVPGQELFVQNIEKYAYERNYIPTIEEQEGPALIYIAAGAWFSQPHVVTTRNKTDPQGKNKVDPWDTRYELFRNHVVSLNKFIGENTPDHDPFTAPMDPYDGIGNLILYAPPAGPRYLGDNPYQKIDRGRRADEVAEMQQWFHDNQGNLSIPLVWSVPGMVVGQDKIWRDPLRSGFHVKFHVAQLRANILFNMRCNAKLDRMRSYPYSRTCCTDYGIKSFTQIALVGLGMVYLTICIFCELLDLFTDRPQDEPHWSLFNIRIGCLVLALLMCYYADRTQMMAKGSKLWQLGDFIALGLPCVAILIFTIRRSDSSLDVSLTKPDADEPFLSTDQIDEWKGWMQLFILIFHWTGAHGGPIHIITCLCVGAYIFQTGYSHTLNFMKEKDFSFNHVAATLLRLNILPCLLTYFMDTDYVFYYLSPLLSFWFLVVYATMAFYRRHNADLQFLLVKICFSCILVSVMFLATPFTVWAFYILQAIFKTQWSAEEWQHSVTLNIFIVYVGMLAAIINREMKNADVFVRLGLRVCLALGGLFSILHYLSFTSGFTEGSYMKWHPYVSAIPILSFIAVRNIPWAARNYYSRAMAWLGRCSLEAYALQFHLLLAADTQGILIVDGLFGDGTLLGDRWRTLVIIVPIFLWISHAVAESTTYIANLLMHESAESEKTAISRLLPNWIEMIPGCSDITEPKIRIVFLFLLMWCLNLMTPGHDVPVAMDGGHSFTEQPGNFTRETPSLVQLNGTTW